MKAIVVTGVTGAVGPHLLHSLLARTEGAGREIICLVRAGDDTSALSRVAAALASAGYGGAGGPRLRAVAGDLALPRLGLSAATYDDLADRIDQVVHAGAWLGAKETFSAEALSNVTGTTAIVELAVRANARLDHVSTIGALRWTPEEEDGSLPEVLFTEHPEPATEGEQYAYYFTKWMAEQVAIYASDRIPVTIHRLSDVFSHDGDAPVSAFLGAVNAVRALPDDESLAWSQHSISDRFSGEALATLALDGNADLRVFHDVAFVGGISVGDVRRALGARGIDVEAIPAETWMNRVRAEVPWLQMLEPWQIEYLVEPKPVTRRFDNRNFVTAIGACGLTIATPASRLAPFVANLSTGG